MLSDMVHRKLNGIRLVSGVSALCEADATTHIMKCLQVKCTIQMSGFIQMPYCIYMMIPFVTKINASNIQSELNLLYTIYIWKSAPTNIGIKSFLSLFVGPPLCMSLNRSLELKGLKFKLALFVNSFFTTCHEGKLQKHFKNRKKMWLFYHCRLFLKLGFYVFFLITNTLLICLFIMLYLSSWNPCHLI